MHTCIYIYTYIHRNTFIDSPVLLNPRQSATYNDNVSKRVYDAMSKPRLWHRLRSPVIAAWRNVSRREAIVNAISKGLPAISPVIRPRYIHGGCKNGRRDELFTIFWSFLSDRTNEFHYIIFNTKSTVTDSSCIFIPTASVSKKKN